MKAAVLHEARQPLQIEELEIPHVGDEDVLIKVAACGVCHTDLKVVEGRNRFTPPTILGHEVAGTLEQVGSRCQDFKAGDRVIIGMRYKCGRCRYCLTARENLCERRPAPPALRKADGTSVSRWNVGGFAEYVSVPAYMVFRIPSEMSMEEASIVGCRVTTAYNAVKHRGRLEPGDSALVIGCGGIGLNTIQFLRCFGAYPIIAVDIVDDKPKPPKSLGLPIPSMLQRRIRCRKPENSRTAASTRHSKPSAIRKPPIKSFRRRDPAARQRLSAV